MANEGVEDLDLNKLPGTSLANSHSTSSALCDDLTASATCAICLEQLEEKAILIPCKHDEYHFVCIGTWLQLDKVCPYCKAQVTGVKYREDGKLVSYHLPEVFEASNGKSLRVMSCLSSRST